MMNWLLLYFTTNTVACGGNKKVRLSPHPIANLPPANLWVLLRKTLEKTARMGGISGKNPNLAHFYDCARTHFQQKM